MPAPSWVLELVVIFSVGCYSYGWFSVQTLIKERNYSSTLINGMRMLIGGILCAIGSFFIDPWSGGLPLVTNWVWYGWYIFLISCVGIFCYTLYANLLKYYSITFVAFAGFTEPLFAAFYAWILLGETVSWIFFVATVIVGIGLYQFYQEELQTN
jgi:drug/metabolite transporter (DMT)-like permease